jgi:hypothetical protein
LQEIFQISHLDAQWQLYQEKYKIISENEPLSASWVGKNTKDPQQKLTVLHQKQNKFGDNEQ